MAWYGMVWIVWYGMDCMVCMCVSMYLSYKYMRKYLCKTIPVYAHAHRICIGICWIGPANMVTIWVISKFCVSWVTLTCQQRWYLVVTPQFLESFLFGQTHVRSRSRSTSSCRSTMQMEMGPLFMRWMAHLCFQISMGPPTTELDCFFGPKWPLFKW